MTQNERVAAWLQDKGCIDPLTSWTELGVYRLGARIYDLKKKGMHIETKTKKVTNKYGETCEVALYVYNTQEMFNAV